MTPRNNNLQMPGTETPADVFGTLIILAIVGCVVLSIAFSFLHWGLFWGVIIVLAICAFTIDKYTETVPGFFARIVLNHLGGQQRTIFQGLHLKLPWESVTRDVDLRVDLKDVLKETYASKDALMETKYVYTMRPRLNGEAVILYASYETDALKQELRSLLSMLLSDYYGRHDGQDLLDKYKINQEVFEGLENRLSEIKSGKELINEFEESHGVEITARLEDSDFDEATQAARDTVSRAKSFSEAVKKLTESGIDQAEAEKVAKLMNLPGVTEYIISLNAKGVENLRDVTLLTPPGLGGKRGGKK